MIKNFDRLLHKDWCVVDSYMLKHGYMRTNDYGFDDEFVSTYMKFYRSNLTGVYVHFVNNECIAISHMNDKG